MSYLESKKNIYKTLDKMLNDGEKICASSSFQTQSVPLLHILSEYSEKIPILFIDTGFHFAETYTFKNQLEKLFNLKIVSVQSNVSKINQIGTNGNFLYDTMPDNCCEINKTTPLHQELFSYNIWITGVRKDQTAHRKQLNEFEKMRPGLTKFHPMLDWNSKMVYEYMKHYNLPQHPLEDKGYFSVGCMPCTRSAQEDIERNGRWFGLNKKECGIHLTK